MVGAAAAQYGIFQCGAQAWQRFTRVEQLGFGSCQQLHVTMYFAGDPGQGLHEIQRSTFTGQQQPGRPLQLKQRLVRFDEIAIFDVPVMLTSSPAS